MAHRKSQTPAKILIVEDVSLVADLYAATLERVGHRVVAKLKTGEMAFAFLADERVDLVLMDIELGDGIDGITTAIAIYNRDRTRCVFLSTYGDLATVLRAQEAHPVGYLIKPVTSARLENEVELGLARIQISNLLHDNDLLRQQLERE